ncbi:FMN reductase [Nocardioides daeguensis]|uniref:FMN reductase n=1 Tax=Nocardioides daeguensis TaxID=908359 RepID=A0ABP6W2I6_9ACTN|nr:FMN reductase [Nocardioides daeguensis]MBV6726663.1 FMN reductase [Nocardioides daeguensis]MCR1774585.1 FMN reductase [Nocardioides daeguensis]
MTTKIVVVSAGLSVPSSTKLLADKLGEAVERAVGARGQEVEVQHVELRPLAHALADHLLTGFATGELAQSIDAVRHADGLVVVTPVFSASYSGLFKTFFDVLDNGMLDGVPVVIAATAGTARHSLVLDHALRPLFAYLRAVVVPTGVFAASEDFGAATGGTDDGALDKRVERAAGELAALLGAGSATAPAARRRSVAAGFAAPTPFEQLLREAGGSSVR